MIIGFASFGLLLLVLRETRGSVLLSRAAEKLRKETGDQRYAVKADEERASLRILIKNSLTRPLHLLFTEPVVLAFSAWIGMGWGVLYLLLEGGSNLLNR
jgi:hypothetical protein